MSVDKLPAQVERLIRSEIRDMKAYQVADASGLTKLDAMENPYGWPDELLDGWLQRLRGVSLNRYPDPGAGGVREMLRQSLGLAEGLELILGNGSDELIQLILQAVAGPGRQVMAPGPSFVMYRMISASVGLAYQEVPLTPEFELDCDAMLLALAKFSPDVLFIAYPNNPSGNLFDSGDLASVIEAAPGLVVVDEAYFPFAGKTVMSWLDRYDNLLVMRTLSKSGLAGLRLGYLVGHRAWIQEFDKLRLPYNINVLTQVSAVFALEHEDVFAAQAADIRRDRKVVMDGLAALEGVRGYPSDANFILFRLPAGTADQVFTRLREAGVLVKNLGPQGGPLEDCLRVTVGTPDENRAFLKALSNVLT
ncbi:MAG: histidinol-phosphate transaminase [Gammaproteobacteria bacterium]|nr:histidinol-phosphate transaminase [Gammaproteobacteria bacterium]